MVFTYLKFGAVHPFQCKSNLMRAATPHRLPPCKGNDNQLASLCLQFCGTELFVTCRAKLWLFVSQKYGGVTRCGAEWDWHPRTIRAPWNSRLGKASIAHSRHSPSERLVQSRGVQFQSCVWVPHEEPYDPVRSDRETGIPMGQAERRRNLLRHYKTDTM